MNPDAPRTWSPSVQKLILRRAATQMIPTRTPEPLLAGLAALTKPPVLIAHVQEAARWVADALAAVRAAPDNRYGDDEEAIAAAILEHIDRRTTHGEKAG